MLVDVVIDDQISGQGHGGRLHNMTTSEIFKHLLNYRIEYRLYRNVGL